MLLGAMAGLQKGDSIGGAFPFGGSCNVVLAVEEVTVSSTTEFIFSDMIIWQEIAIVNNPIPSGPSAQRHVVFVVFRSVTVVARHCASNVILNEFGIENKKKG